MSFADQYGLKYNDPTGFISRYVSGKEGGRKQIQRILQNPTKYSYGDLLKVVNSNTSPGAIRPKARGKYFRAGNRQSGSQASAYNAAKQNFLNSMLAKMMARPAPPPAPKPAPPPPAAPQARLQVRAPSTPKVSTSRSQDQAAALRKALADAQASFKAQMGQQTQSYEKQLAAYQSAAQQQLSAYQSQAQKQFESQFGAYQTASQKRYQTLQQQSQAQLSAVQQQYQEQRRQFESFQEQSRAQLAAAQEQAEESQRQMMIGLAQRDRAPAEVKMAESGAAQRGLTRRGTTGYFGRQGMRIGSLNVPQSGLTISADAAGRAASGSFM